jgi:hypothetical protein
LSYETHDVRQQKKNQPAERGGRMKKRLGDQDKKKLLISVICMCDIIQKRASVSDELT